MKIGSYTPENGKLSSIKHFRPSQAILFVFNIDSPRSVGTDEFKSNTAKLNVNLQNSKTGNLQTIIPYISLLSLAEISTFNEGVVLIKDRSMTLPVLLHPTDNISIDNDKYLEFSLIDIPGWVKTIDIYSFETGKNTDFVTKYNKMSCPAGSARSFFSVADNDFIQLPISGFDSIRVTYKNGIVSDMTPVELSYYMAQNNDVTAYNSSSLGVKVSGTVVGAKPDYLDFTDFITDYKMKLIRVQGVSESFLSICSTFIFNLLEAQSVEIIRDSQSDSSLEFVLGDFIKNA